MLHPGVIKLILHFPGSLVFLEFILVSSGPVLQLGVLMTERIEMAIKCICNITIQNAIPFREAFLVNQIPPKSFPIL